MSLNPEKKGNHRKSSILKGSNGNGGVEGDNTTETFNRVSKRISFSATNNVKEFEVGESIATIWGQSLEVNATSSDPDPENVSKPPDDVISLFADTENNLDDVAMDVEMAVSHQHRQSVIQRSANLNQTMFMNETCDITNINKTICATAMNLENMSVVGTNKRRSVVNVSVDNSIPFQSKEKLRKINESQMNLTLAPDSSYTEMAMEIDDDPALNLDETRIWDADLSITDDFSNETMNVSNHRILLFEDESPSSIPSNKTSTTITNIVVDDHSMISFPNCRKPKTANETRLFGHDDVNAGIDQTVLSRNLLEDNNFSQHSFVKYEASSSSSNGNVIGVEHSSSKNTDATCHSILTNSEYRAIEQLPTPMIRNSKESILTDDFMSVETRHHCEHGLDSLEVLDKHCHGENQRLPTIYNTKSGSTLMNKDAMNKVKHHYLEVLEKQGGDEEQGTQTCHHAESESNLMNKENLLVPRLNGSLRVMEVRLCDEDQRSQTHHSKSGSTLEEQRSPTFHHAKSGSSIINNEFESAPRHHVPDSLEVLEQRRRDEEKRSPSFHHTKPGSSSMNDNFESVPRHYVPDSLEVLEQRRRDEEKRSPSFHHTKPGSSSMNDNFESVPRHYVPVSLEVLEQRRRDEEKRSPSFHHTKPGSSSMNDNFEFVPRHYVPDSLEVLEQRRRDEEKRSPSFHHTKPGSSSMNDNFESVPRHYVPRHEVTDLLEVWQQRHRDEEKLEPSSSSMNDEFAIEPRCYVPDSMDVLEKQRSYDQFAKVRKVSKSLLPSLNQTDYARQNVEDRTSHKMRCSMKPEKDDELKHGTNISSQLRSGGNISSQLPNDPGITDNRQKFSSTKYFDSSINSSQAGNQFLAICDLTFANCDPLSSTKILAKKSLTPSVTHEMKQNQTSLTFNSSSPILRKSRLGASSHNNTDDLCNLEPEQLRQIDMKKMLLDTASMLSETKHELVDESKMDEESTNDATDAGEVDEVKKAESQFNVGNNIQCQKCINCRRSTDGNMSFLKIEDLKELQLDFSGYDEFKGLATYRDVIKACKRRREAKELAKQSLVDQNVPYPGWELLWENKKAEISLSLKKPEFVPMLLTCFPMRMSIEFLLKNKIVTEYTKWKYFDSYFLIGAIALRHEKIPSIRIHIKFDRNGPARAQELSIPLAFKRIFVEECPFYMKTISARNYLKHKHGLAMLPLDLTTMCSNSENIYKALDQFDDWFESVVAKVNEVIQLSIECDAFLKLDGRQCFIEKTVFDIKKFLMQKFVIKLDNIDKVGPRDVCFYPFDYETTDEFNNLPLGLPFLRAFLKNPKSFLSRFIDD